MQTLHNKLYVAIDAPRIECLDFKTLEKKIRWISEKCLCFLERAERMSRYSFLEHFMSDWSEIDYNKPFQLYDTFMRNSHWEYEKSCCNSHKKWWHLQISIYSVWILIYFLCAHYQNSRKKIIHWLNSTIILCLFFFAHSNLFICVVAPKKSS